jgi:DNA polymerase III delta prime subunit
MIEVLPPLLSEQLRPSKLCDITLPSATIRALERMVQNRKILNMVFYGKPGIGKTSAARILLRELDADVYELNGSFNNGEKTMVKSIENFAYTVSLRGRPKICFIDEADQMSAVNQNALRYTIEQTSANTRFLMTANDISKLTSAIKSRCLPICFDLKPLEAAVLVEELTERYDARLNSLGFKMDPQRIREIVGLSFPDMRMIANRLELEAA